MPTVSEIPPPYALAPWDRLVEAVLEFDCDAVEEKEIQPFKVFCDALKLLLLTTVLPEKRLL